MWAHTVPTAQAAAAPSSTTASPSGKYNHEPFSLRSACGAAGSLWSACGNSNNMLHQCEKATTQHGENSPPELSTSGLLGKMAAKAGIGARPLSSAMHTPWRIVLKDRWAVTKGNSYKHKFKRPDSPCLLSFPQHWSWMRTHRHILLLLGLLTVPSKNTPSSAPP